MGVEINYHIEIIAEPSEWLQERYALTATISPI